ncbi:hypothetical protein ACFLVG_00715 [Chloroflexota bacterium]
MNKNHTIGGILSIISGAFGFFHLAMALFSIYMCRSMFNAPFSPYTPSPPPEFFTVIAIFYGGIGSFLALLGIVGIVGGVYALKKKGWVLALAGAIAGTFTFFPCGIPAIIFITLAKQEFSATTG